jgi:hypothetical protein
VQFNASPAPAVPPPLAAACEHWTIEFFATSINQELAPPVVPPVPPVVVPLVVPLTNSGMNGTLLDEGVGEGAVCAKTI